MQRGETLESIAAQYGITVAQLRAANPSMAIFYAGLKLEIPESNGNVETFTEASNAEISNIQTNQPESQLEMKLRTVKMKKIIF